MVAGDDFQRLAAESARFGGELDAEFDVLPEKILFVFFALCRLQDLLRNLGFTRIVGQGGNGQICQRAFTEPRFFTNQHAQRHGVERMKLWPLLFFITEKVQQHLLPFGNNGGSFHRQIDQLFARLFGRTRHVVECRFGLACGLGPGLIGTRRDFALGAPLFFFLFFQSAQFPGEGLLCSDFGVRFNLGHLILRRYNGCLGDYRARLSGALLRVVVKLSGNVQRMQNVHVLLGFDQKAAGEKRVLVPCQVQPYVESDHDL